MTLDRDLDRRLVVWLDERAVASPPHDLLARSLTRVDATRQRPSWLAGGFVIGRTRTIRGTLVPAWIVLALAILTAIAVIVIGSRLMMTTLRPEPSASPGLSTQTPSPSLTETPDVSPAPLGGRGIVAEVFEIGATGPCDLVSLDAGTGVRTLLGSVPGPRTPRSGLAGTVSFQRTIDHVLILGGDSGQHVSGMTAAGDALGLIAASEIPLDCCANSGVEGMRLSPRGDRVAFLAVDRFDTPLEIVVVNVTDGTSSRVPLPATAPREINWVGMLDWSPDGSAVLLYGCRPCNHAATPQQRQTSHHSHLYVLPLDGSSPSELGDIDNGAINGAWAPDGLTIDTAIWWCAKGSHMPR